MENLAGTQTQTQTQTYSDRPITEPETSFNSGNLPAGPDSAHSISHNPPQSHKSNTENQLTIGDTGLSALGGGGGVLLLT